MRPIKFRAWNKETKQMIDLHKITPLALSIQPEIAGACIGVYVPDHPGLEVEQFTGLLDCKGKEVFEGDRVKVTGDDFFCNNSFSVDRNEKGTWDFMGHVGWSDSGYWLIEDKDNCVIAFFEIYSEDLEIEVIGNIHETHDIL